MLIRTRRTAEKIGQLYIWLVIASCLLSFLTVFTLFLGPFLKLDGLLPKLIGQVCVVAAGSAVSILIVALVNGWMLKWEQRARGL